jgi:transposase InsO family protein
MLWGRADLCCDRRAGEHVLRALVPEAVPPCARGQAVGRGDPRCACRLPPRLRRAQDLEGTQASRCRGRPRPRRPVDAPGRPRRRAPRQEAAHDDPDEAAIERARDLLQRDFIATGPNEKWVADITYIRTWNDFVYLGFILDCYSRMIVGWQLATHMRTGLVLRIVADLTAGAALDLT